jgi:lipid-binding SYLF domain-containing protein
MPRKRWLERSDVYCSWGRERRIGGSITDEVMLFMNDHALQSLMSDKFKIGSDATVAAGPVGRNLVAGTDLNSMRRSCAIHAAKRVLAGVSLDGAIVQADRSGDKAMYGSNATRREILEGKIAVPKSARRPMADLARRAALLNRAATESIVCAGGSATTRQRETIRRE